MEVRGTPFIYFSSCIAHIVHLRVTVESNYFLHTVFLASRVVAAYGNRLLSRVGVWYYKGKYQIVPRTKLNYVISWSVADHPAAHVSSNEMDPLFSP